jgi:hypothetical protein
MSSILFDDIVDYVEADGADCNVTRYPIVFGNQDTVTGLYVVYHDDEDTSTFKMPVFPRGFNRVLSAVGVAVRYDAVGFSRYPLNEGDVVYTLAGEYYKVESNVAVAVGEHIEYYISQLTLTDRFLALAAPTQPIALSSGWYTTRNFASHHRQSSVYILNRWWFPTLFRITSINQERRIGLANTSNNTSFVVLPLTVESVAYYYHSAYSMVSDGTYLHFVYAKKTGAATVDLCYRRCLPYKDGGVAWDTEQVIDTDDNYFHALHITLDSSDYPVISYWHINDDCAYIDKSSTKDGTWTASAGFPNEIVSFGSTPRVLYNYLQVVPLANGEFYAIYGYRASWVNTYAGKHWNGSVWSAEETITPVDVEEAMHYDNSFVNAVNDAGVVRMTTLNAQWSGGYVYQAEIYARSVLGVWTVEKSWTCSNDWGFPVIVPASNLTKAFFVYVDDSDFVADELDIPAGSKYVLLFMEYYSLTNKLYYAVCSSAGVWGDLQEWNNLSYSTAEFYGCSAGAK